MAGSRTTARWLRHRSRPFGLALLAASLPLALLSTSQDLASAETTGSAPRSDRDALVDALEAARAAHAVDPDALPIAFRTSLTAWQMSPRSLVHEGDPAPGESDRYRMTHPVFVFEWADGRQVAVDAGLERAGAADFGAPAEWIGADPMRCNSHAWDAIGARGRTLEAVVFTHLHVDHISGVRELCRGGAAVPIRLSPEQETSDERFERQGREWLDAAETEGCAKRGPWVSAHTESGLEALAGLPGIYRVAVPGHTPGSQLIVGFVADAPRAPRVIAVAGDVVNHRAGFERDLAKPWWYRWLIVREDEEAQRRHRATLRSLAGAGFELFVNHDLPGAAERVRSETCPEG